ncbi:putative flippase GtrA (transmembrane translocase of bactoprenol-linked glucose) [Streptoalloteichus tenebrarius]|uniref:Flippase GtrA (Transmembrane translocase of bactoprenol-linked glucose) n=1 Tax=Streptoalloteichus tenebrarius (strain ATCC 17920 / DSM 40477 / JCM 4838 / CBS 697.72 / NBRC 16177 / NCIMB 11028 / NRRL B-12390 / A12253. 1 / ISP 5477) TaxID=1933 RepID=A0ABT1I1P2_STRSD|nr:GtrA family protein [Streptoalloteichus tenebrarius]MCP2261500.1 putative flippase GtrA (transmembrane translocase of bactoprenol-linked glucose) [Streptoalloteichus tenebrarius]BFE99342.1 hypothetical protein GCM10020241_10180 [Streptoalloteichus tenebrarius]
MSIGKAASALVPQLVRDLLERYRELLRFATVGGFTCLVDNGTWYGLKLTVMSGHPVKAKAVGIIVATIVSYFLNREWSFSLRGGRKRHHEAVLFFAVSGLATALNLVPLYVSRYLFHLQVPEVDRLTQEIADFASGSVVGTLVAMAFRWWALRKWVFPQEKARQGGSAPGSGGHVAHHDVRRADGAAARRQPATAQVGNGPRERRRPRRAGAAKAGARARARARRNARRRRRVKGRGR